MVVYYLCWMQCSGYYIIQIKQNNFKRPATSIFTLKYASLSQWEFPMDDSVFPWGKQKPCNPCPLMLMSKLPNFSLSHTLPNSK